MQTSGSLTAVLPRAARSDLALLWALAAALSALATWIDFAALPGVNWLIWTLAASLALLWCARRELVPAAVRGALVLAVLLAGTAAVTAVPVIGGVSFIALGALAIYAFLPAFKLPLAEAGVAALAQAPFVVAGRALLEAGARTGETLRRARAERSLPVVRGFTLALIVGAVLLLLLAQADPTLTDWRDGAWMELKTLSFLPRLAFFLVLGTALLGALGTALRTDSAPATPAGARSHAPGAPSLSGLERLLILAAVVGVFALFFCLQLSYLFGNPGGRSGSGITYAEATHRGFFEMTLAAGLSGLLILLLEHFARRDRHELAGRVLGLTVVGGALALLASAYLRVAYYEAAYGFTVQRLLVQLWCAVLAVSAALLVWEVASGVNVPRLLRRLAVTAVLTLALLGYWNHTRWIVEQNLIRYERTGRIDIAYLGRLGRYAPDAVPALIAALPHLRDADAEQLRDSLIQTVRTRRDYTRESAWYEWNWRREEARSAVAHLGLTSSPASR